MLLCHLLFHNLLQKSFTSAYSCIFALQKLDFLLLYILRNAYMHVKYVLKQQFSCCIEDFKGL